MSSSYSRCSWRSGSVMDDRSWGGFGPNCVVRVLLCSLLLKSAANRISEGFLWIKFTGNMCAFPLFWKIPVPSCVRVASLDGGFVKTSRVWEKFYNTAGFRWWQMKGCGHKDMGNHPQASWNVSNKKKFGSKEAKQCQTFLQCTGTPDAPAARNRNSRGAKLFHPLLLCSAPPLLDLSCN